MTRLRLLGIAALVTLATAAYAWATPGTASKAGSGARQIALLDDCDASDPGWAALGGCTLRNGDVSLAEFFGELHSPLSAAVVGHPAWAISPTYLKVRQGKSIRVTNRGGRQHTFTEVAAFGGGKVPPLNEGLVPAPECAGSVDLQPGDSTTVSGLAVGNHRFMCCIHPWMRALIKVKPGGSAEED